LGGAALLGLVGVAHLVAGPFFSLSTNSWPVERHGTALVGGVQGPIKGTESGTGTVRVASGFLGLRSLSIIITEQTKIPIDGKLGGIGDLDRGQLVRISYEMRADRLVARQVDVLNRAPSSDPVTPTETTAVATAKVPIAEAPRAITPMAVAPMAVAPTPMPPAVSEAKPPQTLPPRRPTSPPRTVSPSKRQKATAPLKRRTTPARRSVPATQANTSDSAPLQSGVSRVPRTPDAGSAAVDWGPKTKRAAE
jgi:hypothetical protein